MRRGTTPTHNFETEIDLTGADVIYITYAQRKSEDYMPLRVDPTLSKVFDEEFETILELEKDRMTITPECISVTLTQEETLAFSENKKVYIQIRVGYPDKSAIASDVIETRAQMILKDGVI